MKNKNDLRANFNLLFEFMLAVAGVVIVAILVFSVNEDARTDIVQQNLAANCGLNSTGGTGGTIGYGACGIAYNATVDGDEAAAKVPARLPLLGTAVVFGVVLYVVFRVIPFRAGADGSNIQ